MRSIVLNYISIKKTVHNNTVLLCKNLASAAIGHETEREKCKDFNKRFIGGKKSNKEQSAINILEAS